MQQCVVVASEVVGRASNMASAACRSVRRSIADGAAEGCNSDPPRVPEGYSRLINSRPQLVQDRDFPQLSAALPTGWSLQQ